MKPLDAGELAVPGNTCWRRAHLRYCHLGHDVVVPEVVCQVDEVNDGMVRHMEPVHEGGPSVPDKGTRVCIHRVGEALQDRANSQFPLILRQQWVASAQVVMRARRREGHSTCNRACTARMQLLPDTAHFGRSTRPWSSWSRPGCADLAHSWVELLSKQVMHQRQARKTLLHVGIRAKKHGKRKEQVCAPFCTPQATSPARGPDPRCCSQGRRR